MTFKVAAPPPLPSVWCLLINLQSGILYNSSIFSSLQIWVSDNVKMSMFLWVSINLQILVKLESKPLIFWCNMFIPLCRNIQPSYSLLYDPGKVSVSLESKSRSIKYEGFRFCHDDFLFSWSAHCEDITKLSCISSFCILPG